MLVAATLAISVGSLVVAGLTLLVTADNRRILQRQERLMFRQVQLSLVREGIKSASDVRCMSGSDGRPL